MLMYRTRIKIEKQDKSGIEIKTSQTLQILIIFCSLSLLSLQTFGIIFTMAMGSLLQAVSVKVANLFLCGSLLIGSVLTGKIF